MKRVGIISLYYHNWNFGGMLQAYGLAKVIRGMGYSAEQISFNKFFSCPNQLSVKEYLRVFLCSFDWTNSLLDSWARIKRGDQRCLREFRSFASNEVPHGKFCGSKRKIRRHMNEYDCLITGSDQVWGTGWLSNDFKMTYGLQFASDAKRKLSYAASIGAEGTALGKEDLYRDILAHLDFISVREKSIQKFLQPLTDKPITVVLDPTMLLTQQEWDALAVIPEQDEPYLLAYFLNEANNRHDGQLHQIADQINVPVRCITDELERYPRPNSKDRQILDDGPKEFLGEIRGAEMVFTNSFHGMVLSVLFHKPFWIFKRSRDHDVGSMNSRITDFLEGFDLSDRMLENGEIPDMEKLLRPIDYDRVDQILEEKRIFSLHWLKDALGGE